MVIIGLKCTQKVGDAMGLFLLLIRQYRTSFLNEIAAARQLAKTNAQNQLFMS